VSDLRKEFRIRERGAARTLTAVDGVSLDLYPGETVALVGESGSGKSTVARCIARLIEPTSGEVTLGGVSLTALPRAALPDAYGDLQMVFQDPSSSLNPRMTVRTAIEEPLRLHNTVSRAERDDRVRQLIDAVELSSDLLDRYPRQLSGGQRQRVGIARALAVEPKVVLLDEPTASLDVSIRGQILDLLGRLQREKGLAYLFITHDLETVRAIADRVLVMYLGSILEEGPTHEVFNHPTHPYTRALLSSAPVPEYGRHKERFVLSGEIPSPIDLPTGCRLATRCPLARPRCSASIPPLIAVSPGHAVACPVVLEASEPRPTGAPVAGPHAASVSSK
ncbi:MAG: peptide/nickel transport system ATP-binding protein, partial [Actinomycetota bacterium]|nr:peptide/nickel transport system ATP-binding protein [Actinomycetota bacterium]